MWLYLNYYKQICKKPHQKKVIEAIEAFGDTKQVINKSGRIITKHKVSNKQFCILTVGCSFK